MTTIERDLLYAKQNHLIAMLETMERVVVAFSAGVDSTYLLSVAKEACGDSMIGVVGVSPSLKQDDIRQAKDTAAEMDVDCLFIETKEFSIDEYLINDEMRCYHCKKELFTRCMEVASSKGMNFVIDGTNADDLDDDRPGLIAAKEIGVRSPLLEVGLSKKEIRSLSKARLLPTWNKPAAACLSSRVPHGTEILPEILKKVEASEKVLTTNGFTQVRVRYHNKIARIVLDEEEWARMKDPDIRHTIYEKLRDIGFIHVTVDILPYGSS